MKVSVVTIFPGFFDSPLATGLLGKAVGTGALEVGFVDPRSFTTDRHRSVDDIPYGGGAGMVMKPDILGLAIDAARDGHAERPVVLLTPQGRPLVQADLQRWSRLPGLVLVAGRYEGFDERVRPRVDEEVSLGDFVLTGGEYAALTIADGIARLLPGVLGNEASAAADSFSDGLLEHAHYTRPVELGGAQVPEVLRSGDHAAIAAARRAEALARTRARRPDLLAERGFDAEARQALIAAPSSGPSQVVVVAHAGGGVPSSASLADAIDALPIRTWVRLAAAYGVERWIVVPPDGADRGAWTAAVAARIATLQAPASLSTPLPRGRSARARAEEVRQGARAAWDRARAALVVGDPPRIEEALWVRAAADAEEGAVGPRALGARLGGRPLVVELGATERAAPDTVLLAPARVVSPLNDLGPAAAAAVVLDRLLGER